MKIILISFLLFFVACGSTVEKQTIKPKKTPELISEPEELPVIEKKNLPQKRKKKKARKETRSTLKNYGYIKK